MKKVKFIGKVFFYLIVLMLIILIFLDKTKFCFEENKYKTDEFKKQTALDLINYRIKKDKKARKSYLLQKGVSLKDIDKKILDLEKSYQKEREKIINHCFIEDTNCWVKVNKKYDEFIFVEIKYYFDKESISFFNSVDYVTQDKKTRKWYPTIVTAEKGLSRYFPCRLDGEALGEGSYTISYIDAMRTVDPNKMESYQILRSVMNKNKITINRSK